MPLRDGSPPENAPAQRKCIPQGGGVAALQACASL